MLSLPNEGHSLTRKKNKALQQKDANGRKTSKRQMKAMEAEVANEGDRSRSIPDGATHRDFNIALAS